MGAELGRTGRHQNVPKSTALPRQQQSKQTLTDLSLTEKRTLPEKAN